MMTTRTWRNLELIRTDWDPGPWDDEPDKVYWVDDDTDLDCLIVRNRLGALCGYVGVPPTHPWHGKDYDDVPAEVHGGLTYADRCQPAENEAAGICHVPAAGRSEDVWWLGFDTAHACDRLPWMGGVFGDGEYRDIAYVTAEVVSLAKQAGGVQ